MEEEKIASAKRRNFLQHRFPFSFRRKCRKLTLLVVYTLILPRAASCTTAAHCQSRESRVTHSFHLRQSILHDRINVFLSTKKKKKIFVKATRVPCTIFYLESFCFQKRISPFHTISTKLFRFFTWPLSANMLCPCLTSWFRVNLFYHNFPQQCWKARFEVRTLLLW